MKIKFDAAKVVGIAGTVLGVAATLISNYSDKKELDAKVEEKVAKALAEQIKNKES
nr:MAG TPA: YtxH-like protein [Herelleviridae sp.]